MMRPTLVTVLILVAVSNAQNIAPLVAQISPCVLPCFQTYIQDSCGSPDDWACACETNNDFTDSLESPTCQVSVADCYPSEIEDATSLIGQICAEEASSGSGDVSDSSPSATLASQTSSFSVRPLTLAQSSATATATAKANTQVASSASATQIAPTASSSAGGLDTALFTNRPTTTSTGGGAGGASPSSNTGVNEPQSNDNSNTVGNGAGRAGSSGLMWVAGLVLVVVAVV